MNLRSLFRSAGEAAIPPRLRLPLAYWNQRRLGGIEPEILLARRWARPGGVAIDVGANSGLYTFELARWFDRVEALEPNPTVHRRIARWGHPRVHLRTVGASSERSQAVLHVPISETGVEYAGWGTLDGKALPASPSKREVPIDLVTLDSLEVADVAFVKIDVEGHEAEVLKGARETLRRWRPVVMVETKAPSRRFVLEYFRELGYQAHLLEGGDLQPLADSMPPDQWPRENVFGLPVPQERV